MTGSIAISGASGFVGTALVAFLSARGTTPVLIDRASMQDQDSLKAQLRGVQTLVHLVGLAHRTDGTRPSFDEYRAVNVDLLRQLLDTGERAGIRRVVMLSSLHVFMNDQLKGRVTSAMAPQPGDDYGRTKLMAEEAALAWSARTAVPVVILRPPLVYGAGAKGNLAGLMRLLDSPLPLPFGKANAPRAMVALHNLCDAIDFCARRRDLPGGCFFVQDPQPRSLAELMRAIRRDLGRPARLLPLPAAPMRAALVLLGRERLANQLFSELTIEDDSLRLAGWQPPSSGDSDISSMVSQYRDNNQV